MALSILQSGNMRPDSETGGGRIGDPHLPPLLAYRSSVARRALTDGRLRWIPMLREQASSVVRFWRARVDRKGEEASHLLHLHACRTLAPPRRAGRQTGEALHLAAFLLNQLAILEANHGFDHSTYMVRLEKSELGVSRYSILLGS